MRKCEVADMVALPELRVYGARDLKSLIARWLNHGHSLLSPRAQRSPGCSNHYENLKQRNSPYGRSDAPTCDFFVQFQGLQWTESLCNTSYPWSGRRTILTTS